MREVVQPVTKRVFEGEICRVTVELLTAKNAPVLTADRRVWVEIAMLADATQSWAAFDPAEFEALMRDLAAVNERVQETVREMQREPVKA